MWQPSSLGYSTYIRAASWPMNVFAYPFRWIWADHAADFRVHQMGGKFTRGYCKHLEEFEWRIPQGGACEAEKEQAADRL